MRQILETQTELLVHVAYTVSPQNVLSQVLNKDLSSSSIKWKETLLMNIAGKTEIVLQYLQAVSPNESHN